nr:HIT domain-containing protein [Actinomycetota bacterium]
MPLERLWAGWRGEYVAGAAETDAGRCVLCRVVDGGEYILTRGPTCVAVLNAYPYTSGHLMVLPARHVGDVEALTTEESGELWSTLRDGVVALKVAYTPDGLNVGA